MTIKELQEKRAALLSQRKALHEKAVNEGRDLTDDEDAQFRAWKTEADALKGRIEQAQEIEAEQAELERGTGRQTYANTPATTTTNTDVHITQVRDNLIDHPFGGYGRERAAGHSDHEAQRERKRAFGEFSQDVYRVRSNGLSDRLAAWNRACLAAGDGMITTIGSEGGYLLPQSMSALVDRIALENSVVRPRATVIPVSSLRTTFPVVDDTTHASSTVFGGIAAYFKSEEAQLTSSKPAFSSAELDLHKLTALAYVSGEMLDWSPISIGAWLPDKLAQALAWKEDDKFISGSGAAGEPRGLLNSACAISVSKETGQAAATLVTNNIVKMDARLFDTSGRQSICWIASRTCKTQLPLLSIGVGTGGALVFQPADGLAGRPLATLYGYPIVFTEKCAALGTIGDLLLCNCSEYLIGDAQGKTRSERDIGLKFDYDQTAFRIITYVGGTCPWRSAFTPKAGDSLAPVVKLATRS